MSRHLARHTHAHIQRGRERGREMQPNVLPQSHSRLVLINIVAAADYSEVYKHIKPVTTCLNIRRQKLNVFCSGVWTRSCRVFVLRETPTPGT